MRVAIIGLGDIAQKAYLPVLADRDDIELVLCTRDSGTLNRLSAAYRIAETVSDPRELRGRGIDAAFVHAATSVHVPLAADLLQSGAHVYIDKPLAYSYEESRLLVELAENAGRLLMTGFNRRFAPMYAKLEAQPDRRLIVMQKNRIHLPDAARRFIFDDFIHVVDTLRFLLPQEAESVRVSSCIREGKLHHVMLHLDAPGCSAVGIMNRDSGISEETLELMSAGHKWSVRDLQTTVYAGGGEERIERSPDWEPILRRRGFFQITDHFLHCARTGGTSSPSARDSLETHRLCERIVQELEQSGALPWRP